MNISGKVAIVTGGGRGIGEAVALALAREGVQVVLASRTPAEIDGVAARLQSLGGRARAVPTDVSRLSEVNRLVDVTLGAFGRLDILVNSAGVYGPIGSLWEVDPAEWVRATEINLLGTFYTCQAVLPHMIRNRWGRIINFSGGGATSPLARFSAYGVSKAAVVRLTETLAEEVREFNIQVNAIAPGAVDTRLQDAILAAGEWAGALFHRISRLRESGEGGVPPELAAELAVFLATEASDGLTGKLISAPHDDWRSWDAGGIRELNVLPWLTLRRMDPFTLRPFLDRLQGSAEKPG